ncbi:MAG: hypothetical protein CVV47_08455 [Spirochaetae bacterium HGW-Spirochaetae-3]|jgi:hypothetical protein|nr:MAG: hypothetical protein CVV47_08455 [Spirochaetae bacterium HGW-Spirochaetae-3]
MGQKEATSIRPFVLFTYLLFWILFSITGLAVFLQAPPIVLTVLKNICAWSSTFVVLLLLRHTKESIPDFIKKQFPRVGIADFMIPTVIQALIVALSILCFILLRGESVKGLSYIKLSDIVPAILINITSGPSGEELGWRGYALNALQKKHSPLVSAILIGLLWGAWHFPLWLVSGLSGYDLVVYSLSFMLGICSFSVFLTYFYNKSKNLLVAVWVHFLFNMLLQIVLIEDYRLITIVSVFYLVASTLLILIDKKSMTTNDSLTSAAPRVGGSS